MNRSEPRRGSARLALFLVLVAAGIGAWWWLDQRDASAHSEAPLDVAAYEAELEGKYADDARDEILAAWATHANAAPDRIEDLHVKRRQSGEYELLDVAPHVAGEPVEYPKVPEDPHAAGLVRVHVLPDGRYCVTRLRLEELGDAAAWAVETAWLRRRANELGAF